MIVETHHPVAGTVEVPGLPIKLSDTPGAIDVPAPVLGQHTDEILRDVIYKHHYFGHYHLDENVSKKQNTVI